MSYESPTLKIRLELTDPMLGMDCHVAAERLVGTNEGVKILAAKWGREPTKWRETGADWGRNTAKLTDEERGYVAACRALATEGSVEARLVAIIDRLTSPYPNSVTTPN